MTPHANPDARPGVNPLVHLWTVPGLLLWFVAYALGRLAIRAAAAGLGW